MADNLHVTDFFQKHITVNSEAVYDQFGLLMQEEQSETTVIPLNNIADKIDDDMLDLIGVRAYEGYNSDVDSMADWSKEVKDAKELAKQENKAKDNPFPGASNFKTPVITNAVYKFADSITPEILKSNDLVSTEVIGEDENETKEKSADNYSIYANYQINQEMPEWRDEQEKLFYDMGMDGNCFKQVVYDSVEKKVDCRLITYPNFAVNNKCTSTARLRRFNEVVYYSKNDIEEKFRLQQWTDPELFPEDENQDAKNKPIDESEHKFIIQQGYYDIDEDGYEEPYTFVVHCETQKVVKITPRFELEDVMLVGGGDLADMPESTKEIAKIKSHPMPVSYDFLKDVVTGGLLGIGFAHILGALSRGINSATNNLLNTATLANVPGGFLAKGFKAKMGNVKLGPGQWNQTEINANDLANGIRPNPTSEPSPALFNLVGMLVETAQEIGTTNVLSVIGANAPATTTLSLLMEQQSTRSAIVKRIHRSMTREFKQIFEINKKYHDPEMYKTIVGSKDADAAIDLNEDNMSIVPSANPDVSSKVLRVQQASAALQVAESPNAAMSGGDMKVIYRNYLEAIGFRDFDEVFPEETPDEQLQKLFQQNPELMQMVMGEKARADATQAQLMDAQEADQQREDNKEAREDAKVAKDIELKDAQVVKTLEEAKLKGEESQTEDLKNNAMAATTAMQIDKVSTENQFKKADTRRLDLENDIKEVKLLRGEVD